MSKHHGQNKTKQSKDAPFSIRSENKVYTIKEVNKIIPRAKNDKDR